MKLLSPKKFNWKKGKQNHDNPVYGTDKDVQQATSAVAAMAYEVLDLPQYDDPTLQVLPPAEVDSAQY